MINFRSDHRHESVSLSQYAVGDEPDQYNLMLKRDDWRTINRNGTYIKVRSGGQTQAHIERDETFVFLTSENLDRGAAGDHRRRSQASPNRVKRLTDTQPARVPSALSPHPLCVAAFCFAWRQAGASKVKRSARSAGDVTGPCVAYPNLVGRRLMVRFARHQRLYEQSRGGWRREVRLKVTLPAEESNLAVRDVE